MNEQADEQARALSTQFASGQRLATRVYGMADIISDLVFSVFESIMLEREFVI